MNYKEFFPSVKKNKANYKHFVSCSSASNFLGSNTTSFTKPQNKVKHFWVKHFGVNHEKIETKQKFLSHNITAKFLSTTNNLKSTTSQLQGFSPNNFTPRFFNILLKITLMSLLFLCYIFLT